MPASIPANMVNYDLPIRESPFRFCLFGTRSSRRLLSLRSPAAHNRISNRQLGIQRLNLRVQVIDHRCSQHVRNQIALNSQCWGSIPSPDRARAPREKGFGKKIFEAVAGRSNPPTTLHFHAQSDGIKT